MALIIVEGDLLQSDCNVICHQANCFNVMGSGIAKSISDRWPSVYYADRNYYPKSPMDKLGKCSSTLVENDKLLIYNLYGQYSYGTSKQQTNYEALEKSFRMMLDELKQLGVSLKIGIPYGLGAGRGGGDWNVISAMIDHVSSEYGVDIHGYRI